MGAWPVSSPQPHSHTALQELLCDIGFLVGYRGSLGESRYLHTTGLEQGSVLGTELG